MPVKSLSPIEAKALADKGALLIDVREPHETAMLSIPGSLLHPLSAFGAGLPEVGDAREVVFLCASGGRTDAYATQLAGTVPCTSYVMAGGIFAWKIAGLPVETAY